jgi:hypothetical protein
VARQCVAREPRPERRRSGPPIADRIDLDGTFFIGCGGICAATVWTLGLLALWSVIVTAVESRDALPTEVWRRRAAHDPCLTEANIAATEHVLNALVRRLRTSGSEEAIFGAVRDAVIELNRLGGLHGTRGNFIETQEREELCEFLNRAARDAGLGAEASADVTWQWRTW